MWASHQRLSRALARHEHAGVPLSPAVLVCGAALAKNNRNALSGHWSPEVPMPRASQQGGLLLQALEASVPPCCSFRWSPEPRGLPGAASVLRPCRRPSSHKVPAIGLRATFIQCDHLPRESHPQRPCSQTRSQSGVLGRHDSGGSCSVSYTRCQVRGASGRGGRGEGPTLL